MQARSPRRTWRSRWQPTAESREDFGRSACRNPPLLLRPSASVCLSVSASTLLYALGCSCGALKIPWQREHQPRAAGRVQSSLGLSLTIASRLLLTRIARELNGSAGARRNSRVSTRRHPEAPRAWRGGDDSARDG